MSATYDLYLSKKLYAKRLERQMKQQDLADSLGLSQQAYSNLERGETSFSDEVIEKICHTFGISVEEFMSFGNQVNITNSPQSNNYNTNSPYNDIALLQELKLQYAKQQDLYEKLLAEKDARLAQYELLLKAKT
jgi:transcriptional regulator with XRE-family HTH domain